MDCTYNTMIKKLEDMRLHTSGEEKVKPKPQKFQNYLTPYAALTEEKRELKTLKSKIFFMQESAKDKTFKTNKVLDELKSCLKRKDETIAALNKTQDELKKEIQSKENIVKKRDEEIETLNKNYEEKLNILKRDKDSYIKHLESDLRNAVSSKNASLKEVDKSRNYEKSYKKATDEILRLKDKNHALTKENRALEDDVEQIYSDYEELKKDFRHELNSQKHLSKFSRDISKKEKMNREFMEDLRSEEKDYLYTRIQQIQSFDKEEDVFAYDTITEQLGYLKDKQMVQTRRNELLATTSDSSDDIEEEEDRKLFVGGLSMETTKRDILKHFLTFGEIDYVKIKTDDLGKCYGYAFVVYKYSQSLRIALESKGHIVLQRKVNVEKAYCNTNKIFVTHLNIKLTDDEILRHFEQFGKVVDIKQPYDKIKNQRKTYCFITFKNEEVTKELIRIGTTNIKGVDLVIRRIVSKNSITGRIRGDESIGYSDASGYPCDDHFDCYCDNCSIDNSRVLASDFYV